MPAVVITGSSSGIGAPMRSPSTASAFHVFAGVHRQEDGQALRRAASERLLPVRIDVTDGASITAARDLVAPGSTPPDCRAGQQRRHHGGVPRGVPAAGRVPPAAGG
jgi:NAD(P)-dependent dehydrogenase (short-subunit alcohol dehydrogenase family)